LADEPATLPDKVPVAEAASREVRRRNGDFVGGLGTPVSNGNTSCPVERHHKPIARYLGVITVSHVLSGQTLNTEFVQRYTQASNTCSFARKADIMNHVLF